MRIFSIKFLLVISATFGACQSFASVQIDLPQIKIITHDDIVEHDLDDSELAELVAEGWAVVK